MLIVRFMTSVLKSGSGPQGGIGVGSSRTRDASPVGNGPNPPRSGCGPLVMGIAGGRKMGTTGRLPPPDSAPYGSYKGGFADAGLIGDSPGGAELRAFSSSPRSFSGSPPGFTGFETNDAGFSFQGNLPASATEPYAGSPDAFEPTTCDPPYFRQNFGGGILAPALPSFSLAEPPPLLGGSSSQSPWRAGFTTTGACSRERSMSPPRVGFPCNRPPRMGPSSLSPTGIGTLVPGWMAVSGGGRSHSPLPGPGWLPISQVAFANPNFWGGGKKDWDGLSPGPRQGMDQEEGLSSQEREREREEQLALMREKDMETRHKAAALWGSGKAKAILGSNFVAWQQVMRKRVTETRRKAAVLLAANRNVDGMAKHCKKHFFDLWVGVINDRRQEAVEDSAKRARMQTAQALTSGHTKGLLSLVLNSWAELKKKLRNRSSRFDARQGKADREIGAKHAILLLGVMLRWIRAVSDRFRRECGNLRSQALEARGAMVETQFASNANAIFGLVLRSWVDGFEQRKNTQKRDEERKRRVGMIMAGNDQGKLLYTFGAWYACSTESVLERKRREAGKAAMLARVQKMLAGVGKMSFAAWEGAVRELKLERQHEAKNEAMKAKVADARMAMLEKHFASGRINVLTVSFIPWKEYITTIKARRRKAKVLQTSMVKTEEADKLSLCRLVFTSWSMDAVRSKRQREQEIAAKREDEIKQAAVTRIVCGENKATLGVIFSQWRKLCEVAAANLQQRIEKHRNISMQLQSNSQRQLRFILSAWASFLRERRDEKNLKLVRSKIQVAARDSKLGMMHKMIRTESDKTNFVAFNGWNDAARQEARRRKEDRKREVACATMMNNNSQAIAALTFEYWNRQTREVMEQRTRQMKKKQETMKHIEDQIIGLLKFVSSKWIRVLADLKYQRQIEASKQTGKEKQMEVRLAMVQKMVAGDRTFLIQAFFFPWRTYWSKAGERKRKISLVQSSTARDQEHQMTTLLIAVFRAWLEHTQMESEIKTAQQQRLKAAMNLLSNWDRIITSEVLDLWTSIVIEKRKKKSAMAEETIRRCKEEIKNAMVMGAEAADKALTKVAFDGWDRGVVHQKRNNEKRAEEELKEKQRKEMTMNSLLRVLANKDSASLRAVIWAWAAIRQESKNKSRRLLVAQGAADLKNENASSGFKAMLVRRWFSWVQERKNIVPRKGNTARRMSAVTYASSLANILLVWRSRGSVTKTQRNARYAWLRSASSRNKHADLDLTTKIVGQWRSWANEQKWRVAAGGNIASAAPASIKGLFAQDHLWPVQGSSRTGSSCSAKTFQQAVMQSISHEWLKIKVAAFERWKRFVEKSVYQSISIQSLVKHIEDSQHEAMWKGLSLWRRAATESATARRLRQQGHQTPISHSPAVDTASRGSLQRQVESLSQTISEQRAAISRRKQEVDRLERLTVLGTDSARCHGCDLGLSNLFALLGVNTRIGSTVCDRWPHRAERLSPRSESSRALLSEVRDALATVAHIDPKLSEMLCLLPKRYVPSDRFGYSAPPSPKSQGPLSDPRLFSTPPRSRHNNQHWHAQNLRPPAPVGAEIAPRGAVKNRIFP